jgi:nickel-dependent lactate racemase
MDISFDRIFEPGAAETIPTGANIDLAVAAAFAQTGETKRLTVLVNDPQRHTASAEVLRHVLTRVPAENIRLLVAAGSHSFSAAIRQAFEDNFSPLGAFAEIAWHDGGKKHLPHAAGNGSWRCHPWLIEESPLLAIGSVEPHYFAGFTGAHKTATVGCASCADIEANHSAAMNPACRPARLSGNPVHEGIARMLDQLADARNLAAVNLVQAGRKILACAGGETLRTLHELVPAAENAFVRRIEAPLDAIVAEVTGPLGVSFYQADKGIKNNEWALREGGALVLVAPCTQGIGQDAFVRLLREAATYEEAVAMVDGRGYRLGDHKAVRLRFLTDPRQRGVRVYAVSDGLCGADAALLGLRKAAGVKEALEHAGINASRDRVALVHDAGNVCVLPGQLS